MLEMGYATREGIMPKRGPQPLILAVLRQLADGAEHSSAEIREALAAQFELTAEGLIQKQGGDSATFVNHVAWPLAWLNQAKAIVKVCKGTYRITVYGIAILAECENTQEITLRGLRALLSHRPTAFHGTADCMTSSLAGAV
jgi:restriction endonuclease Mrr